MKKGLSFLLISALLLVCALSLLSCGEENIVYNLNGGALADGAPTAYKEGEEVDFTKIVPVKVGYSFLGWFSDKDCTVPIATTKGSTGEINLYAKWQPNIYSISNELNGGEIDKEIPSSYVHSVGIDLSELVPTKHGHRFDGWFLDEKFNTPATLDETRVGNVTIYAKWSPAEYKIEFCLDGGVLENAPSTYTFGEGLDLSALVPVKPGFTFAGWFSDTELLSPINGITEGQTGEIKIYASWTPNI